MSRGFRYYAEHEEVRKYMEALGYQTKDHFDRYDEGPSSFDILNTTVEVGYDHIVNGQIIGYRL